MTVGIAYTDGNYLHGTELSNTNAIATRTGVLGTGCAVTQKAAGADMSVDISAGTCYVNSKKYTYAGGNQAIDAAHATLHRWDLISYASTGIVYTKGTAAASPTTPALPANNALLALVYVAAADTSITNGEIRDERAYVAANVPWAETSDASDVTAYSAEPAYGTSGNLINIASGAGYFLGCTSFGVSHTMTITIDGGTPLAVTARLGRAVSTGGGYLAVLPPCRYNTSLVVAYSCGGSYGTAAMFAYVIPD